MSADRTPEQPRGLEHTQPLVDSKRPLIESLQGHHPPQNACDWFKENERLLLGNYPGEWIAADDTGWFAHSFNADLLAECLETEDRDDVFVVGLPDSETPAPFYGASFSLPRS